MTQNTAGPRSITERTSLVIRGAWRDAKSIYYANTPLWRWLKSGSLVLFGLFCWSGAAVLLSYRPDWGFLTYVMAYGFLLVGWGPLTHFLIVPLVIRVRRTATHPTTRWLTRHGSKLNLTIFFTLVIVFGTLTPGIMMLEFSGALAPGSNGDVDPDLSCSTTDDIVECHLSDSTGIDHVVVTTGGREIVRLDEPPFEFTIRIDELETVTGQKQFTVELRDAEGSTLRRHVRTLGMIERD